MAPIPTSLVKNAPYSYLTESEGGRFDLYVIVPISDNNEIEWKDEVFYSNRTTKIFASTIAKPNATNSIEYVSKHYVLNPQKDAADKGYVFDKNNFEIWVTIETQETNGTRTKKLDIIRYFDADNYNVNNQEIAFNCPHIYLRSPESVLGLPIKSYTPKGLLPLKAYRIEKEELTTLSANSGICELQVTLQVDGTAAGNTISNTIGLTCNAHQYFDNGPIDGEFSITVLIPPSPTEGDSILLANESLDSSDFNRMTSLAVMSENNSGTRRGRRKNINADPDPNAFIDL